MKWGEPLPAGLGAPGPVSRVRLQSRPCPQGAAGLGAGRRAGAPRCAAKAFKCSIGEGLKFTQGHRGCDNYNHSLAPQ